MIYHIRKSMVETTLTGFAGSDQTNMKCFSTRCVVPWQSVVITAAVLLALIMAGSATASGPRVNLPQEVESTLHFLLDLTKNGNGGAFEEGQIEPLMAFLKSTKQTNGIYTTDDSFDAPSAYNEFTVNADLQRIIDYTLDADIPSFFFWPSSLRLCKWTRVDGGDGQLARFRSASNGLNAPFILEGVEHITITPDQHTGAYYSYDVNKKIILSPYRKGKVMISIYRQKDTSGVGRKGWVLGRDDDWSYLYTRDKGLGLKALGWADTYMYDSFNVTIYFEEDPAKPIVTCGTVSWVKAGWAGINMVQPKHIHRGLDRVAKAFKEIIESPRLPDPATLAKTFSKAKDLPNLTLEKYGRDYLACLEERIASSEILSKKVGRAFDSRSLLEQMTRDELYAVLALDYFKKILGRNPVMDSHPF